MRHNKILRRSANASGNRMSRLAIDVDIQIKLEVILNIKAAFVAIS